MILSKAEFLAKIGDLLQDNSTQLISPLDVRTSLTDLADSVHLLLDGNSVVSNGACTIIGEETGRVRYGWVANDTANAGIFRGEFTVTFASGRIETFPNSTTIRIKIKDSVG